MIIEFSNPSDARSSTDEAKDDRAVSLSLNKQKWTQQYSKSRLDREPIWHVKRVNVAARQQI